MKILSRLGMIVALVALAGGSAWAAEAGRKAELQKRFKERLSAIERLKASGQLGERWDGFAEPVTDARLDEKAAKLVSAENADRRELYALIATEEKEATTDLVGQRNAQRYYRIGQKGEWFKMKNGEWRQK